MMLVLLLVSCGDQAPPPTTGSTLESTETTDNNGGRRTRFVPLDDPVFLSVNESNSIPEDELILALEWGGEARAYPMRMLWFHHIVNDTIAGRPFLITF